MVTLDAGGLESRETNRRIRDLARDNEEILVINPGGMHNFAIGLDCPAGITVGGSLGVYTGGFMQGPRITVRGDTGWYTGDNMIAGKITVEGNCGSNLAPSMAGGEVVVRGRAGSRAGYGLKGGTVVVCGDAGLEAGKMMLGGRIIILGAAGPRLGESMYGGVIHVLGGVESLGGNVQAGGPQGDEAFILSACLSSLGLDLPVEKFTTVTPRPGKHTYRLFCPGHDLSGGRGRPDAGKRGGAE